MKDKLIEKVKTRKRLFTVISLILGLLVVLFLTWLILVKFLSYSRDAEDFKAFINSYGFAGIFVAIGIQMLQVVIAVLPGEFIEIGLGYCYGAIGGTVICLLGTSLASILIFSLTKKWGIKLVELFIDHNKIDSLRFINSEKKLDFVIFLLYVIPGTPKDLLTYFAGLTRLTPGRFLVISTIARIPSVITSTMGGDFLGEGNYIPAIIMFAVTAGISIIGLKIYTAILNRKENRKHRKNEGEKHES